MSKAKTCDVLIGHDEYVARWVERQLGVETLGQSSALGFVLGDELIGGAVYHNYRSPNIEVSLATTSPLWANRKTLYCGFHYPFNLLGCKRITLLVDSTNQKSISLVERLGFVREGLMREARPNDDLLVYGMLKSECKWLNYGKEKRAKAA